MTTTVAIGLAILGLLFVSALRIRHDKPTLVSQEQRRRRLETMKRMQDEAHITGSWFAR